MSVPPSAAPPLPEHPGRLGQPERPEQPSASTGERRRRLDPLALVGLVAAALFWPVGLVLSILALRRAAPSDRVVPLVGVAVSAIGGALSGAALVLGALYLFSSGLVFGLPFGEDWTSTEAGPVPADTLTLGEEAEIGQFTVALTGAAFEPDDSREGINPFAESQQRGTFSIDLTNLDDDARDPWLDLSVSFVGGNGREYWTEPCEFSPAAYGSQLEPGQDATVSYCVYVPDSAVQGSAVLATGADFDERAYWTLDGTQ